MKINLKIVILGDTFVGKTSLLAGKYYSENIQPNHGTNFMTKEIVINDQYLSVEFWDMPGRRSLRYCRVPYYRGADCCVLVYDVTSLDSFKSLEYWRDEFLTETSIPNRQLLCPFVLIGNKVDLNKRVVDQEYAKAWSRDIKVSSYLESSAKYSTNVNEAIKIIAKHALDYKQKCIVQEANERNEQISRLNCCGLFSWKTRTF